MLMSRARHSFPVVLAALVCTLAVAQTPVKGKVYRKLTFAGSAIDTGTFFPKIDTAFVDRPMKPENPMPPMYEEPPIPNDLRVGGLTTRVRGLSGPLWPAINQTNLTPPDCDLAVGNNHVVVVVNPVVGIFTKAGASQLQQNFGVFFSGMGATSFLFDPKCVYDRIHQRYVFIALEEEDASQTSKVLLAVSDDNDPNGIWYRYRLEAKVNVGGSNYWLDYPSLGYNKDVFVINGNLFGFSGGTAGVSYMVVPIAPTLTNSPVTVSYLRNASDFSAQNCEMVDNTIDKVYAISRGGATSMRLTALTNLTTSPAFTTAIVAVPSQSTPGVDSASTNGRTLDSLDGRIFTTMFRGGRLLASHNISGGIGVASRWYEFNMASWPTSGTPSLVQSGDVSSGSMYYHMPAISRNSAGDISMILTRSNSTTTADIIYVARQAADAAGTMGAPNLLESSLGNNYAANRWGDYFGCKVDPVDDVTFWGVGMDVNSTNGWKTSVFSWTVTPPGVQLQSITVDSSVLFNGTGTTGHANLTMNATSNTTVTLLSSNPAALSVPANVVVTTGNNTAPFAVSTFTVSTPTSVTITGTYNSVNQQATVTVNPPLLLSLGISPNSVSGGDSTTGTVTLDNNAQGAGAVVSLSSNNPVAQVPATVTVTAGNPSVNFPITTSNPVSPASVTITATYLGTNKTAGLTVNPAPIIVHPSSFSLSPGSQYSGSAGLPGMQSSDDSYMIMRPGAVFSNSQFPITLQLSGTGPVMIPSQFQMLIESGATATGIIQKVELFVPVFNDFEVVATGTPIGLSDAVYTFSTTTDPERFINPISGEIIAKISYKATAAVFSFPWRARIDEVLWKLFQ
jgi:hypothetical protein